MTSRFFGLAGENSLCIQVGHRFDSEEDAGDECHVEKEEGAVVDQTPIIFPARSEAATVSASRNDCKNHLRPVFRILIVLHVTHVELIGGTPGSTFRSLKDELDVLRHGEAQLTEILIRGLTLQHRPMPAKKVSSRAPVKQ